MNLRRLLVSALLTLATVPVAALAAPSAADAADCTPTITMGAAFQDAAGVITFPASYSLCASSRVAIKYRDRDVSPASWGEGINSSVPAGQGTTFAGTCIPDGQTHRMVGYATIKTPTGGTILAESPKVYYVSTAVTSCSVPPDCTPSLTMDKTSQDSSGYMIFQAQFKSCENSRIRIKWVDRDGINPPVSSAAGLSPYAASPDSSGQIDNGLCVPDGVAHRYRAYALMKTPDNVTIILQSADIYLKSTPVTACGPWRRPAGALNS
jgi:hypothetical protein